MFHRFTSYTLHPENVICKCCLVLVIAVCATFCESLAFGEDICGGLQGDFDAVAECLFGPDTGPAPSDPPPTATDCLEELDYDLDGDVDLHDVAVFQSAYADARRRILAPPPSGQIYHAAFPDFGGWEDEVSAQRIEDFEILAEKPIAWAYFSNNWWRPVPGIQFPAAAVEQIYCQADRLPFIRMMPRNQDELLPDPNYTMQAFIDGVFDAELTQWALDAKAADIPLIVEFGTECNGWWFPWNAKWNGRHHTTEYGDPNEYDGMERFRDAYRHIIDLFRALEVDNITWVFHVDAYNDPNTPWNQMAGYYPGDDYIDWIGVSVYGPQDPNDGWWWFSDVLGDTWSEITSISTTGKPIGILEWGVIDYPWLGSKAAWIDDAFQSVLPGGAYYPQINAMSYWHENFDQTNLRIDSSPEALAAYQSGASAPALVSEPTLSD